MKFRIIAAALAACVGIGAAGCGASGKGNNNQNTAAQESEDTGTEVSEAQESEAVEAEAEAEADEAETSETAAAEDSQEAGTENADNASGTQEAASTDVSKELTPSYGLEDIGITLNLPDEYVNSIGTIDISGGDYSDGGGIYIGELIYLGMPEDEYNEIASKEEPTEEDYALVRSKVIRLCTVFSIDENRGADEIVKAVKEYTGEDVLTADELKMIGQAESTSFFVFTGTDGSRANYENLDEEFAKEYDTLVAMKDFVLENADYAEVARPFAEIIGKKVSFTTTDLDGNPVSSDEIFSEHEITMVNVWATWCHWCVSELPELEKLNNELADKDCAIIGLCGDAETDDLIDEAKKLLEENGDTYLNIRPWDGWDETFDMSCGWPTSFFVDRDGIIIGTPIVGAAISKYKPGFEALLSGDDAADEAVDKDEKAVEDTAAKKDDVAAAVAASAKAPENAYNIYVIDQDEQPVEGAMVQFCTNDTCKMAKTDAFGLASFTDPEGIYDVHILKVPDGYEKNNDEFKTERTYSDMFITVTKK